MTLFSDQEFSERWLRALGEVAESERLEYSVVISSGVTGLTRASSIGACARAQYYALTETPQTNPGNTAYNWPTLMGFMGQELVASVLRQMGYTFEPLPEVLGSDVISGHPDGIISGLDLGSRRALWDSKLRSAYAFGKLYQQGLPLGDPEMYMQMQVYMKYTGCDLALVTVLAHDRWAAKVQVRNKKLSIHDPVLYRLVVEADPIAQQLAEDRATALMAAKALGMMVNREHNPAEGKFPCFVPETRITMADLTTRQLSDIQVGDVLLGFDEHADWANGQHRHMKPAVVTKSARQTVDLVRVTLEDGTVFRATPDHPVLTYGRDTGPYGRRRWSNGRRRWMPIGGAAVAGRSMARLLDVRPSLLSERDQGWLGGLYDGEGSISSASKGGFVLSLAQNSGTVLTRAQSLIAADGFETYFTDKSEDRSRPTPYTCKSIVINGGPTAKLRLLANYRPERLIEKWGSWLDEGKYSARSEPVRVLSVEPDGVGEVVTIETSTGTFVAEGFMVHNCSWDGGGCPWISRCLADDMEGGLYGEGFFPVPGLPEEWSDE